MSAPGNNILTATAYCASKRPEFLVFLFGHLSVSNTDGLGSQHLLS